MFFFDFLLSHWILLSITIILLVYHLLNRNQDYFLVREVKFSKSLPLFGSALKPMIGIRSVQKVLNDIYKEFPEERFIGFFEFLRPVYLIRDPKLIMQIMVKEFDHYMNHRINVSEDVETFFGKNMFVLKDQRWKEMRATLSPAFTGSKMRQMFHLMVNCSNTTVDYLTSILLENKSIDIEMKDFYTRVANDIIATCAFGIETNSLKNKDNQFYKMGKKLSDFRGIQALKFFGYSAFPKLMNFFKISFYDNETVTFFTELVHGNIKYREENNIIRNDMIHLLNEARKGSLKYEESDKNSEQCEGFATVEESEIGKSNNKLTKWTDDDVTSQCTLFMLAGFDTISTLLCFMSHELALNPDVEKKLTAEIDDVRKQLNGKPLTYDLIQKMKYLDMVVCESLRRWPPGSALDRICTKSTTLKTSDGKIVQINKGDAIWFSTYSLQNDPKYFVNPKKFDPERFSDENKDNIQPYTYAPFGFGPRNCIGSRFALMETKAIIFHILSKFQFEKSIKTDDPIRFRNDSSLIAAKNGFWLTLRCRSN